MRVGDYACLSISMFTSQMQSRPFSENDMSLVYLPGKTQNTEKNNTVLLTWKRHVTSISRLFLSNILDV